VAEKQEWKKGCVSAEVTIVSREHYPGGTYEDEYGISHHSRPHYRLKLKINAVQKAVAPNQMIVEMGRSKWLIRSRDQMGGVSRIANPTYSIYSNLLPTIVSVDVHENIYTKLEKCDAVRIYYKPESPLTFLLEEEI
jgi:hypothetical protein